ncbi:MAG: hypothetical protein ACQESG_05400 [Nanobdellota archaeon]
MTSVFRGILDFFHKIGIYDVVLPFLLVFTIVFAIFEKTRVLGVDVHSDKKYTKKNLNAMVAFVIAFFVIASSQLVEIITQVSSQMVILLLLSVFFLLLVGSFYGHSDEPFALSDTWKKVFTVIMFLGIVSIFLMAIKTEDGTPWLEWFLMYLYQNASSTAVASILLMIIVIGLMLFVVYDKKEKNAEV